MLSSRFHTPALRPLTYLSVLVLPAAFLATLNGPQASAAVPASQRHVIVQFTGAPALSQGRDLAAPSAAVRRQALSAVADAHTQRLTHARAVEAAIRDRGVTSHVTESYSYGFNGAAMTVSSADLATLESTPGVAHVYPDTTVSASSLDPALGLIRAPEVWRRHDPAGHLTDGTGEIVAVVDTGIDYDDADLGGGFGPGHQVVAGHDFVNNDDDPMDDNGHGSHVAGIIAGSPATADGITGVAPGARLTAYKVLDADGRGEESAIIAGIEAAIDPSNPYRADVLNMSLGAHADSTDPLEQAAHTASQSGVVVVAAAGNDGPGDDSSESPGDAAGVLSVGASFSGVDLPQMSVSSPEHEALRTDLVAGSTHVPAGGQDLSLVDVGDGSSDSYDGLDVAGKAVLMTYPTVTDWDADLEAAAEHQVAAVLMSTPDYFGSGATGGGGLPGHIASAGDLGDYPFVGVSIDGTTATSLHGMLAQGPVTIHVAGQDATDLLAAFSSHGPAQDSYLVKPDLVAPGVEIRSTWLDGKHAVESGTSMAAPHVAGAAALVLQGHPDWTAAQVSSALASSAHPLDGYAPTADGSGRLDVAASDDASVLPTPWTARLGVASMSGSRATAGTSVELTNPGDRAAHVRLRVESDAVKGAHVSVSPSSLVIPPGGDREVHVSASGPVTSASYDVSGRVVGTVTAGRATSTLRVPYLMAVRPLSLHPTPDPTAGPQTVEIYSEASLAQPPVVSMTGPHGTHFSTTAALDHDHWWQATLPATGPAGTYRLSATAYADGGARVTGGAVADRLGDQGSTRWDSVGPVGDAGVLVTTPADPEVGYMLPGHASNALVQRTADGGRTWTPIGEGVLDGGNDLAIAADPVDPDTVYVAQNGGSDVPYEGRVMVTHDAGASWSTLPLPDDDYRDVEVSSDGRSIAAVDFNHEITYSTDRGHTWTSVDVPTTQNAVSLAFAGHDLFLAAGAQLWRLADLGSGSAATVVWTAPGAFPNVSALTSNGGTLAVAGYDAGANGARVVAVSTDHGDTWSDSAPSATLVIRALDWVGDDLYASGGSQSWALPGGSGTWSPVAGVPAGNHRFGLLGGDHVASVAGVGLYRTTDGTTYQRIGLTSTTVHALGVTTAPDGTRRLVAATVYGTTGTPVPVGAPAAVRDWGRTGTETSIGRDEVSLAVDPQDPHVAYEVQQNAFSRFDVEKSTDGGQTWHGVESARTSANGYQVAVSPVDASHVYVTEQDAFGYGLLVSTDGGQTWARQALDEAVTAVVPDPRNAAALWLGGPDGLFRSTDAGRTVTRLSSTPVSAIALDPGDRSHLVVGGATLAVSHDGGRTLDVARTDPGRMRVSALTFVGRNGVCAAAAAYDDQGLLVGGRGVLCSGDGGRSWHDVSGDLPFRSITSLAVSPDGRWLYAGSLGQGVFRTGVRSLLP